MIEVETVGEEEETNIEEEVVWEDNTTNCDDILNATANLWKTWTTKSPTMKYRQLIIALKI